MEQTQSSTPSEQQGTVLRTEKLVKRYGNRTVVNEVSFHVRQGEIVGLLGPNGAGKTTSFYMTTGLIEANGGKIYLDDLDITDSVEITADVKDFTMDSTYTVALSNAFDDFDFSDIKSVDDLNDKLDDLEENTLKLVSGSSDLYDGVKELNDKYGELDSGIDQLKSGVDKLASGVTAYTDGVSKVDTGAKQLTSGADKLSSGVSSYTNGVSQVNSGASQLATGASSAKTGADQLAGGINSYTDGVSTAESGAKTLSSGAGQVSDGAASLVAGLNELTANNEGLTKGVDQLKSGIEKYTEGVKGLKEGLDQINSEVTNQSQNLDALENGASTLSAGLDNLNTQIGTLAAGVNEFITETQTATKTNISTLQTLSGNLWDIIKLMDGLKVEPISLQAIDDAENNIKTAKQALSTSVPTSEGTAEGTEEGTAEGTSEATNTNAGANADAIGELDSAIISLENEKKEINKKTTEHNNDVDILKKQIIAIKTAVDENISTLQTAAAADSEQQKKIQALTSGLKQLTDPTKGVPALAKGAKTLDAGINDVSSPNSKSLKNMMQTLTGGLKRTVDGAKELDEQSHNLTSGVSNLYNGIISYTSGASKAASGAKDLSTGASKVSSGASSLVSGLGKLTSNNGALKSGGINVKALVIDGLDLDKISKNDIAAVADFAKDEKITVWFSDTKESNKLLDSVRSEIVSYFAVVAHIEAAGGNLSLNVLKEHSNENVGSVNLDSKTMLMTK